MPPNKITQEDHSCFNLSNWLLLRYISFCTLNTLHVSKCKRKCLTHKLCLRHLHLQMKWFKFEIIISLTKSLPIYGPKRNNNLSNFISRENLSRNSLRFFVKSWTSLQVQSKPPFESVNAFDYSNSPDNIWSSSFNGQVANKSLQGFRIKLCITWTVIRRT